MLLSLKRHKYYWHEAWAIELKTSEMLGRMLLSIPVSPVPGHFQNWKEHTTLFRCTWRWKYCQQLTRPFSREVGGCGRSVDISAAHTSVSPLYLEPVADWDTICSACFIKLYGLSKALFCQVKEKKVELTVFEECLIFVKIIPMVCKGSSGSKAAFKRVNYLAPFFDHFAHFFCSVVIFTL